MLTSDDGKSTASKSDILAAARKKLAAYRMAKNLMKSGCGEENSGPSAVANDNGHSSTPMSLCFTNHNSTKKKSQRSIDNTTDCNIHPNIPPSRGGQGPMLDSSLNVSIPIMTNIMNKPTDTTYRNAQLTQVMSQLPNRHMTSNKISHNTYQQQFLPSINHIDATSTGSYLKSVPVATVPNPPQQQHPYQRSDNVPASTMEENYDSKSDINLFNASTQPPHLIYVRGALIPVDKVSGEVVTDASVIDQLRDPKLATSGKFSPQSSSSCRLPSMSDLQLDMIDRFLQEHDNLRLTARRIPMKPLNIEKVINMLEGGKAVAAANNQPNKVIGGSVNSKYRKTVIAGGNVVSIPPGGRNNVKLSQIQPVKKISAVASPNQTATPSFFTVIDGRTGKVLKPHEVDRVVAEGYTSSSCSNDSSSDREFEVTVTRNSVDRGVGLSPSGGKVCDTKQDTTESSFSTSVYANTRPFSSQYKSYKDKKVEYPIEVTHETSLEGKNMKNIMSLCDDISSQDDNLLIEKNRDDKNIYDNKVVDVLENSDLEFSEDNHYFDSSYTTQIDSETCNDLDADRKSASQGKEIEGQESPKIRKGDLLEGLFPAKIISASDIKEEIIEKEFHPLSMATTLVTSNECCSNTSDANAGLYHTTNIGNFQQQDDLYADADPCHFSCVSSSVEVVGSREKQTTIPLSSTDITEDCAGVRAAASIESEDVIREKVEVIKAEDSCIVYDSVVPTTIAKVDQKARHNLIVASQGIEKKRTEEREINLERKYQYTKLCSHHNDLLINCKQPIIEVSQRDLSTSVNLKGPSVGYKKVTLTAAPYPSYITNNSYPLPISAIHSVKPLAENKIINSNYNSKKLRCNPNLLALTKMKKIVSEEQNTRDIRTRQLNNIPFESTVPESFIERRNSFKEKKLEAARLVAASRARAVLRNMHNEVPPCYVDPVILKFTTSPTNKLPVSSNTYASKKKVIRHNFSPTAKDMSVKLPNNEGGSFPVMSSGHPGTEVGKRDVKKITSSAILATHSKSNHFRSVSASQNALTSGGDMNPARRSLNLYHRTLSQFRTKTAPPTTFAISPFEVQHQIRVKTHDNRANLCKDEREGIKVNTGNNNHNISPYRGRQIFFQEVVKGANSMSLGRRMNPSTSTTNHARGSSSTTPCLSNSYSIGSSSIQSINNGCGACLENKNTSPVNIRKNSIPNNPNISPTSYQINVGQSQQHPPSRHSVKRNGQHFD